MLYSSLFLDLKTEFEQALPQNPFFVCGSGRGQRRDRKHKADFPGGELFTLLVIKRGKTHWKLKREAELTAGGLSDFLPQPLTFMIMEYEFTSWKCVHCTSNRVKHQSLVATVAKLSLFFLELC